MPKETSKKPKKAARKTKSTKKGTTSRKRTTTRASAKAPAKAKQEPGSTLRVRQVRSGIGHAATFRRTLRALGLRHHQDQVVVKDDPSIRGMLRKVHHLVEVVPVEAS